MSVSGRVRTKICQKGNKNVWKLLVLLDYDDCFLDV